MPNPSIVSLFGGLAQTAYSPLPQLGCLVLMIKPKVKPEDV
jgi:hypothetical protein